MPAHAFRRDCSSMAVAGVARQRAGVRSNEREGGVVFTIFRALQIAPREPVAAVALKANLAPGLDAGARWLRMQRGRGLRSLKARVQAHHEPMRQDA